MTIRLRTQDPKAMASMRGVRGKAVRLHLLSRLTEKQYRRVALLYGFDGPEMSVRQVAEAEDVSKPAVHYVRHNVLDKLRSDGYLWLLWLVHRSLGVNDLAKGEAWRQNIAAIYREETDRDVDEITDQEMQELAQMGFEVAEPRSGGTDWKSDLESSAYSSYDREIDRLTYEFQNGSLTRVEYDRDMILALAEDMRPDSDALEEDWIELKQEVEWACGAHQLGSISKRERDRRVSLALRSYVSKG